MTPDIGIDITIDAECKVKLKPSVVVREESDKWALLFDSETGQTFGLNPVGVLICKSLDGENKISDILAKVEENCLDVPQNSSGHIFGFVRDLIGKGLADKA